MAAMVICRSAHALLYLRKGDIIVSCSCIYTFLNINGYGSTRTRSSKRFAQVPFGRDPKLRGWRVLVFLKAPKPFLNGFCEPNMAN